jgi:hypothetical protein
MEEWSYEQLGGRHWGDFSWQCYFSHRQQSKQQYLGDYYRDNGGVDNTSTMETSNALPNAIYRLQNPAVERRYGTSSIAEILDKETDVADQEEEEKHHDGPASV